MPQITELERITSCHIYPLSVVEAEEATYFLARRDAERCVGAVGNSRLKAEPAGTIDGRPVVLGPMDHGNAQVIRRALPWTAPQLVGQATSIGLGDRLGLATPGHIRAVRGTGVVPYLAQQSIREMARTERTPDQVMDAATWGVLEEGFRDGFGSDADHLQLPVDIDATLAAGFTLFTVDPGAHVQNDADAMTADALAAAFEALDIDTLETSRQDLLARYDGKTITLTDGHTLEFGRETVLRAAVKYGDAVAHATHMFRHVQANAAHPFELEISVDETDTPTTPEEHFFFASELTRLGVEWVSLAPRFIGRFEKGVDYIGDVQAFRRSLATHAAVMHTVGPYKLSIHSGSDKFSIYPIVTELTGGLVHLKTAGTSYLEALHAVTTIDPGLFREILDFARSRYETDKATYHVSADLSKVPAAADLNDDELAGLFEQFDARQVLHVTFGSVLTAEKGDRFKTRLLGALNREEETHYETIRRHLARHVAGVRSGR